MRGDDFETEAAALRKAARRLGGLGDDLTDEGAELLAECEALMVRLTALKSGRETGDDAEVVRERVRAVAAAVERALRHDVRRLVPYSPVADEARAAHQK